MRSLPIVLSIAVQLFFYSCSSNQKTQEQQSSDVKSPANTTPDFNADSAFQFVKTQVEFGPRVPNTAAHRSCSDFLFNKLKSYTPNVVDQRGQVTAFDGTKLEIRNLIASFNPQNKGRILLFAHWDSRPWADQDTVRTHDPIDAADDGASGVATLLELARQFSIKSPSVGVDIAFFDAEDWGDKGGGNDDSYALGTQFWARQPHVADYHALYGVLLDMTGAKNARFRLEGNSYENAGTYMENIWRTAASLGYSDYFVFEPGGYVTDDHVYVIKYGIPSVDIINSDKTTRSGFAPHWHTHADNLEIIDPHTLKAVGQTLLEVIYKGGVN